MGLGGLSVGRGELRPGLPVTWDLGTLHPSWPQALLHSEGSL
jgi:hypothetical protein